MDRAFLQMLSVHRRPQCRNDWLFIGAKLAAALVSI